jgi:hypothetical protein
MIHDTKDTNTHFAVEQHALLQEERTTVMSMYTSHCNIEQCEYIL